ncbi:restriction endonuclease subunit S [Brevibacillus gelatini]
MRKQQLAELDNLIKAVFYEMFGDPVVNEKGWKTKKLGHECEIITGNTPSRKDKQNYGDYIEWIKSDNINAGEMYLSKAKECLSEKGFSVSRFVEFPSILMTCIAGSIKSIGNVGIANRKVAFNQQINAIVPNDNNVFFLYTLFLFTKEYIQSSINMSLKGILSKGKLADLEFIFPPIELQNHFATILTKIEAQKSLVKKAIEETQYLFDSLMAQYFE